MMNQRCCHVDRRWVLLACILAFLILRVPIALLQLPRYDEDVFAVPGMTILENGIPRIPYLPARNPESVFYKSDEALFALPPLYFYWQAAWYTVFGVGTGVARLASVAAGVAAAVAVYLLGRRLLNSTTAGLWAAGLYLFSRVLYFPALAARPDMLCGAFGLYCLVLTYKATETNRLRDVAFAGVLGGLGMLTHPFALVFCLQAGLWLLLAAKSWKQRLQAAAVFTCAAILAFSLWGLLVIQAPELFRIQFSNNVLNRAGPGLIERFLLPFAAFEKQTAIYIEHLEPLQAGLLSVATLIVGVLALRRGGAVYRVPAALALSGIYFHVACQGTHPTKGYWCYTGALQFVCLGALIAAATTCLRQWLPLRRYQVVAGVSALVLVMLFVPGSGLRTVVAHLRHWDDPNYNAPRFTQQMIDEFTKGDRLLVDTAYVFDFYRAGHNVTLALNVPMYFDARGRDYDYLIAGPNSLQSHVPADLDAVFMRKVGDVDDFFSCHATLFRHPSAPPIPSVPRVLSREKINNHPTAIPSQ